MGVYLWKQAVEKADSFEVNKASEALIGQKFKGPAGEVTMQENHHLINNVFIGEAFNFPAASFISARCLSAEGASVT
ncbi:MAG TPA: transporter substrate-binding protein, partial [Candidatus Acidoferrum sp.]|nr:transporter substrate-binding protein [Candidatus Acidoferrum sp.]